LPLPQIIAAAARDVAVFGHTRLTARYLADIKISPMRIGTRTPIATSLAEPIVGWKIWRIEDEDERTRLRSVLYVSLWPPGRPVRADCKKVMRTRHDAPDAFCECGIHAAKSLAAWRHYLSVGADRIFGRVLLWGGAVEGELGWRAAAAYPLELCVLAQLERAEEIAAGLEVYGVPVEVVGAPTKEREVVSA
jgi:hypothetical protein